MSDCRTRFHALLHALRNAKGRTPSSNALDGFTDEGGRDLSEALSALGDARGIDRSEACRAWHRSAKAPTIGDVMDEHGNANLDELSSQS